MPAPTLVLSVALNLATTALLAYAGALVLRRAADGELRFALRMFATWWFAAATVVLLGGSYTLLALVGITDVRLHLAVSYLTAFPLAIALWALLYYLIYIYTGRRSAIWPLSVAYALFLVFELYYFASFGERALVENAWNVRLEGEHPPTWMGLTFAILLAVPVLGVVIAYGLLFFRAPDAEHRYRVGLVSGAFLLLFGAVLLGYALGWDREPWFPFVYEVPGLIAAAMIVLAYKPPAWVATRLTWASSRPQR